MFKIIATIFLLFIHQGQCFKHATATLYQDKTENEVGSLTFTQEDPNTPVRIIGLVKGLQPNSAHGFHIHQSPVSENSPNCMDANGHFNPYSVNHGPQTGDLNHRHVGDLGNITTDSTGTINIDMTDSIIQLYEGVQSIFSRTVIIHQSRDDGGEGNFDDSKTTGNAGPRIICGLIKLTDDDVTTFEPTTGIPTTETHEPPKTTTTSEPPKTTTTPEPPKTTTTTHEQTTHEDTTHEDTTRAGGSNIQPMILVLIIAMIIAF